MNSNAAVNWRANWQRTRACFLFCSSFFFFFFPPPPPSPIFQPRANSWIYCFNKTTIILPPLYPPATHLWYHELFHHTVRPELWEHHRASPQTYQRDERWPRQTVVWGSDAWINCLQDGAEKAGCSFLPHCCVFYSGLRHQSCAAVFPSSAFRRHQQVLDHNKCP